MAHAIRMRSFGVGAQKAVFAFTCRYHARCAFPLIYFRARARSRARTSKAPWGRESPAEEEERRSERSLIGAETQLFRLSRDRNRIRAGRFAREQDLRETLSSRSICHRLGFLRRAAGPAIFFCSTLKPGNEGNRGRGRKQEGTADCR